MRAAVAAEHAPALLAGQPWDWRIGDATAELCVDRNRQRSARPIHDRLLVISCGAALHHALAALAGAGVTTEVARFPDQANLDLLARISVTGTEQVTPAAVRLHRAIALRRDDSPPLADTGVARDALARIDDAVLAHRAVLHVLRPEAVAIAGNQHPGTYALLITEVDGPAGWLAAGEALSAAMLTATVDQLVAVPISDPVDWPVNGHGYPMVALRIGAPRPTAATDSDQSRGDLP
jgi:hypothetical protein